MKLALKKGSPIVLVGAGSDEQDFSTTSYAVVNITKELFERIQNLRMGREISKAYEVTAFSSECDWISEYDFASERDEESLSCEQLEMLEEFTEDNAGIWQIEPIGDFPALHDDTSTIHVSEFGVKFTAYIKHTNTRVWTERISYQLIYDLFV